MRAAGRFASMLHTGTYLRRRGALSDDSMEEGEMDVPVAVPTTPAAAAAPPVATNTIIATMLRAAPKISDLIFSPGRAPQVEVNGELVQLRIAGVGVLKPDDTARIANDLMGRSKHALEKLKEEGSCDISYSFPKFWLFRANFSPTRE